MLAVVVVGVWCVRVPLVGIECTPPAMTEEKAPIDANMHDDARMIATLFMRYLLTDLLKQASQTYICQRGVISTATLLSTSRTGEWFPPGLALSLFVHP